MLQEIRGAPVGPDGYENPERPGRCHGGATLASGSDPRRLEGARNLGDEIVHQTAVGFFGVRGAERELPAGDLDLPDGVRRAGRTVPERGAGFGLVHLDVERRIDLGCDRSRAEQRIDAHIGAHVRDGELSGDDRRFTPALRPMAISASVSSRVCPTDRSASSREPKSTTRTSPWSRRAASVKRRVARDPNLTLRRRGELDDPGSSRAP